jgi:oligoendopeptidase F
MPDYRAFAWKQKQRFDYTPEDCKTFHAAIEEVAVPAATRIYERRKQKMGVDTLRPWDTAVDPLGRPALKPFDTMEQLMEGTAKMFDLVNPIFGRHFRVMMEEDLLDLDNRKNKASGAYMTFYESTRKPFIFGNAVGIHLDVETLLHEGGHAFHGFEVASLPYVMQLNTPMEFNEVASMSMELLGAPYLTESGMYTPAEAARARIEHLEGLIVFWPYMSLVDLFQHWIYENPNEGIDPEKCDVKWNELHDRFLPGIDYSGLEHLQMTQWHRQGHIHQSPFYYIEYGLAQLGAVQVWGNALKDQAKAIEAYREALGLGATISLPELFKTAGAKFAFDSNTLKTYVGLIEEELGKLEGVTS